MQYLPPGVHRLGAPAPPLQRSLVPSSVLRRVVNVFCATGPKQYAQDVARNTAAARTPPLSTTSEFFGAQNYSFTDLGYAAKLVVSLSQLGIQRPAQVQVQLVFEPDRKLLYALLFVSAQLAALRITSFKMRTTLAADRMACRSCRPLLC